jgi:hypothetical protein
MNKKFVYQVGNNKKIIVVVVVVVTISAGYLQLYT